MVDGRWSMVDGRWSIVVAGVHSWGSFPLEETIILIQDKKGGGSFFQRPPEQQGYVLSTQPELSDVPHSYEFAIKQGDVDGKPTETWRSMVS